MQSVALDEVVDAAHHVRRIGVRAEVAEDAAARLGIHVVREKARVDAVVKMAVSGAHGAEIARAVHERLRAEGAIAVIQQQHTVAEFIGDKDVGPAVVVGIEPEGGEGRAVAAAGPGSRGHVFELPVAFVAKKLVFPGARPALAVDPGILLRLPRPGGVEIQATVAVEIDNHETANLRGQEPK